MSLTKYAEAEVLDAFAVPANAGFQRMARLRRKAHRHHFDYEPRRGYIYVRSRAISSRCNDNFDMFPAPEIKKAYKTFIGKPVFVNHKNANHRRARGVILDAALHEDTNPDGTPDTWVEVLMEVDAVKFPKLAEAVERGDIARTSMGTDVAYSVCTACGNKAYTPADYCQHIPKMKGMKIHRRLASGQTQQVLVAEECYGLGFFENSLLVEDPADPTAYVLGVESGDMAVAAAKEARMTSDFSSAKELKPGQKVFFRHDLIGAGAAVNGTVHKVGDGEVHIKGDAGTYRVTDEDLRKGNWTLMRASTRLPRSDHDAGGVVDLAASSGHRTAHLRRTFAEATPSVADLESAPEGSVVTIHIPAHHFPSGGTPLTYRIFTKRGDRRWHQGTVDVNGWSSQQVLDAVAKAPEGTTIQMGDRVPGPFSGGATLPGGKRSQRLAYGETKAPAKVDTMRAEACPVCGDDEGYNSEKCNVCGYTQPPSQFRDPDLGKAKEVDLRHEQEEQGLAPVEEAPAEDLQCSACGEVFSAEGEAEAGSDDDSFEEPEPEHPDDAEDPEDAESEEADEPEDLDDLADLSDKELGLEDDEEEVDEDEAEDFDEDPAPSGEGRVTPEGQDPTGDPIGELSVEPGQTCPVCGAGTLAPVAKQPADPNGEPPTNEVGTDPAKITSARRRGVQKEASTDMPNSNQRRQAANPAQRRRNQIIAAIAEQQDRLDGQTQMIEALQRQNASLRNAMAHMAVAAKVAHHPAFAPIVRSAGLHRFADSAQNPDGAPATTTEEAAKPQATDDVNNVGAAPSEVNKDVTPEAVTDVNNSNVAANPPVLDNLQDVTKPTEGTDAVHPDAATGEGEIKVSPGEQKTFDSTGPSWTAAKGSDQERFVASMRLARRQIEAGIERGEDLSIAQKISSSDATLREIMAQAETLEKVAATAKATQPSQRHRSLVPRAAARPSQPQGLQPSMQTQAQAVTSRPEDDEWMIGSPE